MPKLLCHLIAVACGAGAGVRCPTGAEDYGIGFKAGTALQFHGLYFPILSENLADRAVGFDFDIQFMELMHHGIHDILSLVADGKHTLTAFHLGRYTLRLEEVDNILIVIGPHGAVEELAIAVDILDDFRHGGGIGDIAAALAGNQHLLAGALHFFEYGNISTVFRRLDGGHHACGAGTDYNDFFHDCSKPAIR